jgi:Kef-type K+ transport system membrane component KefB
MVDAMTTVKRLLTLAALIAFAYLVMAVDAPAHHRTTATVLLGFILLGAYIAGAAASGFKLPRLTGYVLVGILVGPYALGIFTHELVESLRTIDELALALIALTAGGELKLRELRKSARSILGISFGIVIFVMIGFLVLVLAVKPVVPSLARLSWGLTAAEALLLAIWAANSSPDATIAVINESGARGEVTDTVLGVTIFKDVVVIVLFAVGLSVAGPLAGEGTFDPGLIGTVAWEVVGAFVVGGLLGWLFSLWLERRQEQTVLVTLLFSYLLVLVSHAVHVELLLTAVGAGFVIENFSEAGDRFIKGIEANSLVVFAIFFALAGAALDLGTVVQYWPFAVVIVLVRGVLTWGGATVGARITDASEPVRRLSWMGLISQAGVTLGLSLLVAREFPSWGSQFVAITTAVIIVHLLLGPVLLKISLARAGETPGGGTTTSKKELLRSDIVAEQGGA